MKPIAESNGREAKGGSWLELVRRQVSSLNFGVVQIVVHGARVVQIERTEKVRLENPIAVINPGD
ncbi:MAG TPA: YezD family protein [Candidatus Polarisedimenticolia bacterium]|nr:YezD family protein [Candidatus Polarisedimenticolia bacterium]